MDNRALLALGGIGLLLILSRGSGSNPLVLTPASSGAPGDVSDPGGGFPISKPVPPQNFPLFGTQPDGTSAGSTPIGAYSSPTAGSASPTLAQLAAAVGLPPSPAYNPADLAAAAAAGYSPSMPYNPGYSAPAPAAPGSFLMSAPPTPGTFAISAPAVNPTYTAPGGRIQGGGDDQAVGGRGAPAPGPWARQAGYGPAPVIYQPPPGRPGVVAMVGPVDPSIRTRARSTAGQIRLLMTGYPMTPQG